MNFTIEVTASPALLEAINNLTRAFCGNGAVQTTTLPPAVVTNVRSRKRNTITTAAAAIPSIEQIRAAVREKCMAEKKEEAKALLDRFGVERIHDLPEEVRAEFLAKVEAL